MRIWPLMASMPIVEMISPITPPIRPLRTEPEETEVIMEMPKMARAKYSGLENCSATEASRGEKIIRQMAEKIPPKVEEKVDRPRARLAGRT